MNILIEIRHPHHAHVFRGFYFKMLERGHNLKVVAVDKEMTYGLLDSFKIPYEKVGANKKGLFNKLKGILKSDIKLFRIARKFKPDIFVAKASPTMAHVSFLMRKPYVLFTDTENAKLLWLLIKPFVSTFVSPDCFEGDFGRRHVKFDGYLELAYLHKDLYHPSKGVLRELGYEGVANKYALIRFVSWNASHDIGQSGFNDSDKKRIVEELSKHMDVFISSEGGLPNDLKKYQLSIEPDKIFDVMSYASIYIGEGATMASECVMLGTPSIYVNSLDTGYMNKQERDGLLFRLFSADEIIDKSIELVKDDNKKAEFIDRSKKKLAKTINVTSFMIWFIENYPKSVKILRAAPDYQYNFR